MGPLSQFSYSGAIQASKSLMNRCLVVQSFFPELSLQGNSDCDDVVAMEKACGHILSGNSADLNAGEGGTTLRFLLGRVSRLPGVHFISCHHRLLERPHEPLLAALRQLGVEVVKEAKGFRVTSEGWELPAKVSVDGRLSSQFASSLLLSAWGLEKPLLLDIGQDQASKGYLDLTVKVLQKLGMEIQVQANEIVVPSSQSLGLTEYFVEPDVSSIFTLGCFAALLGNLEIQNFPMDSLQPDSQFLQIFKEIGIPWTLDSGTLKIQKARVMQGGSWNLGNTPDLFPVLAILLSQCSGPSTLSGLGTLAHKESHRIESTSHVLGLMGAIFKFEDDNFWIQGGSTPAKQELVNADPFADHRVAMGIRLAVSLGYPLRLQNPEVVRKSFPHFFEILGAT